MNEIIIALSTPPGMGAIGVIRLSGTKSIEMVNAVFRGKDLSLQERNTVHFGRIADEDENTVDEVVVSLFRSPQSYTGEDVVEISCHGSPYILQRVTELLIAKGARPARAGEFTLRAFLNGKIDLSQAEAVADLIASDSAAAHKAALDQMRGGYSEEIQRLRDQLVHFASMVELELDFSEEDVEFADRQQLIALIWEIQNVLDKLIRSFRLGNVIRNGVTTVIAGRPNAGKSTLLNALMKEDRAIVSEIPGTTRDTIEEMINIGGLQFRLIDTAGIRDATGKIEALGIERTFSKLRQSALVLYVFDVSDTTPQRLQDDLKTIGHELKVIPVANKTDLVTSEAIADFKSFKNIQFLSSKTGTNVEALGEKMVRLVMDESLGGESHIVTNTRHLSALQRAQKSLEDVLLGIDGAVSGEFLAQDIRLALEALGEITGEVTTEDLLGNIFSKFCIGK